MKINAVAAFLLMLLLVVYPLVGGIQTDASKDMARFIPDNVLVYFEQSNASNVLKDYSKSPLGKKISTIDIFKTGRKVGVAESTLAAAEKIIRYYTSVKDNKLFHEVFGKRFAVAIFAPKANSRYTDLSEYIKDNSVVVAKPVHGAEELEFFAESFGKLVRAYSISSSQYGKHHVKRVKINGQTFFMAIVEGMFVMSLNQKKVRRCLDTYDRELPSFTKNSDFARMRKSFNRPDRFFYLPVNEVREQIESKLAALASFPGQELLRKELATTVGFSTFGYASWNKKRKVIDKILVQFDGSQVNNVVKNHIEALPSRCSMLSLTSEDPMAFYWSNTVKLKHFAQYFQTSREEDPQLEKFWSTVKNITGKNIEEIMAMLGEEIGLVLEPDPKDDFFSFPLGMLFLRISDVPGLKAALEKVIDAYAIPVSVKTYGPVSYTYWTPSPQDGLQPLYGFWGDLLFLGNSSRLLKMVVDRREANLTILDNPAIKALDPGFTGKNNSITYVNTVSLAKVLQKWLALVGMTLAIEDRDAAYKVHTILEEIIDPLLDGIGMYEKSCTRSYFTPEMVVIDSITNKNLAPVKKRTN